MVDRFQDQTLSSKIFIENGLADQHVAVENNTNLEGSRAKLLPYTNFYVEVLTQFWIKLLHVEVLTKVCIKLLHVEVLTIFLDKTSTLTK